MTLQQTINALDILMNSSNADICEYIKSFNGYDGFMYTREEDPNRKALQKKMEDVLDEGSVHSGASWGYMLRTIQSVLNGTNTYEQIVEAKIKEVEAYNKWLKENIMS